MFEFRKTASLFALSLAAGIYAVSASAAFAAKSETRVRIGTLVCTSDGSLGKVITSTDLFSCVYKPNSKNASVEHYDARIDKFGLTLGVTGKTQMTWLVMAADKDAFTPGALGGQYAGISAGASLGVGGEINLLGGGARNSFTLQPLSTKANTGANLAVGVTKMTLIADEPVKQVPVKKHKRHK